jgi:hypothetical protein
MQQTHANQKDINLNRTMQTCSLLLAASQQRKQPKSHQLAYGGGANQLVTPFII